MTEIRLTIRQKDKSGFAHFKTTLTLTEKEFNTLLEHYILKEITTIVPSIEFEVERVEVVKL